jgi:predicted transcriptional regulator
MSKTEELLFEDTFRNTLGSLKRMLLEYHAQQDPSSSSPTARKGERAQELINEEIRRTITKLQNLQQNNYSESYKIAAYSLLSAQLLDETESTLTRQVTPLLYSF